jgi:hypothetical protein
MRVSFGKSQVLTGLLVGLLSCLATSVLSANKATTPVKAPEISKWDATKHPEIVAGLEAEMQRIVKGESSR